MPRQIIKILYPKRNFLMTRFRHKNIEFKQKHVKPKPKRKLKITDVLELRHTTRKSKAF